MKVVVRFCEDKSKEIEIEIDENSDVKNVKLLIEKVTETNEKYTADYFHIFHRNIILDNDRMVKFYAIEENDEIYIGKIKHYLQIDDEIVELFVIGHHLSFEHVVVKRNDSISQLKLLISRIIPDCFTVWSSSGFQMLDDQIISDILIMNNFYKFITGCGVINAIFYNDLKIHDRYLVSSYVNKQKISFWSLESYSESEILQLKEKLIKLKNSLENTEIIPKLNESLSNIPPPLMRSRYLFCMNTADEILDICNDYWSDMIGEQCVHRYIQNILRVELNEELLVYSNIDSNITNIIDTVLDFVSSKKNILIDIISELMTVLLIKHQPLVKCVYKYWIKNIAWITLKYIDSINGIAEDIICDIKRNLIIGYENILNWEEIINKYKPKICELLMYIGKERKLNFFLFYNVDNERQSEIMSIINKSIDKILNFIQIYVGNRNMINGRFENIIKQHIACLLREYLDMIISCVAENSFYKLKIDEIINESIRRMFIRIALINYTYAKSGLHKVNYAYMNNDENLLSDDVTNEILENGIISNELIEILFGLLPDNSKFEKIVKNEIDRLILEQNFDCTLEAILKESVLLFLVSEFPFSIFIEKSVRWIFYFLFDNDKVYEVVNKINSFYPQGLEQNREFTNNIIRRYVIPLLINTPKFQEIFRNMLSKEPIKHKSWINIEYLKYYYDENRIKKLMEIVVESALNPSQMESDKSLRNNFESALNPSQMESDKSLRNNLKSVWNPFKMTSNQFSGSNSSFILNPYEIESNISLRSNFKFIFQRFSSEPLSSNYEFVLDPFEIELNISLRSILINALDKCINSFGDIFENPSYFMKFIRPYLLTNQSDSYIYEILTAVSEEHFAVKKIKIKNYDISLQIPVCQIKTNSQLKQAISAQTKVPKELIYMIKYGEDEISKDEENIGSICDYLITFVSRFYINY